MLITYSAVAMETGVRSTLIDVCVTASSGEASITQTLEASYLVLEGGRGGGKEGGREGGREEGEQKLKPYTMNHLYTHTAIHPYSNTPIQACSHTAMHPFSHTAMQLCSHAVIQPYTHTTHVP